ncbi:CHAT domain-containing protein [Saccharothrix carnea]|uniref:CHAT domain-containing protein n=1 Tax=Saccharothrix carnea TaxID=1280637 RepID=A0A2P8HIC7_SACCR|nr:CHAT domain-containing protein [Saccharothrix carnea]PSL45976.1 CHAT domain-containing protein [Saccharothrix carnea]
MTADPDPRAFTAAAVPLLQAAEATGDAEALDRGIALLAAGLEATGDDDPMRAARQGNLGNAWSLRFHLRRDPHDLRTALDLLTEATGRTGPGHPHRPNTHLFLGVALLRGLDLAPRTEVITAAVTALEVAAAEATDNRPLYLVNLGNGLRMSFEWQGGREDLDRAVAVLEEAARLAPADPVAVGALGGVLSRRYAATGEVRDGLRALELLRATVDPVPAGHPARIVAGCNLGHLLVELHQRTGGAGLVDDAITVLDDVLSTTAPGHPERSRCLLGLGTALRLRGAEAGDVEVVERSVAVLREAAADGGVDHARQAFALANALRVRFDLTGARDALAEAVTHYRSAVAAVPGTNPDHVVFTTGLTAALRLSFEHTGDVDALAEAMRAHERVVPTGTPEVLSGWSALLRTAFHRNGDLAVLHESAQAAQQAVDALEPGSPRRPVLLSNLAMTITDLAGRTGRTDLLDHAVTIAEAAVDATPPGHADHATRATNLSTALVTRFELTGDLAAIDAAVRVARAAADGHTRPDPRRAAYLTNLGNVLVRRYEHTGDTPSLHEAVAVQRDAVEAATEGHPDRARALANLGHALSVRFEAESADDVLKQAVKTLAAAVDASAPGDPSLPGRQGNLSSGLVDLHRRTGEAELLDLAIALRREALDALDPAHLDRATHLNGLGIAHLRRYEATGDRSDLDRSITALERAVEAAPAGDRRAGTHLYNLGNALATRARRHDDRDATGPAHHAYRRAVAEVGAPALIRASAARAWGGLMAEVGDHPAAVEGYEQAVELLDTLAWRGLGRRDQELLLTGFGAVAGEAAAAAISAGRPERAVELLEQGRSVLWNQVVGVRRDRGGIGPGTTARLDRLRAALDGATGDADRRLALAAEWDRLVASVRESGFPDFLRAPSFDRLRAVGDHGPVVVVNAASSRCDALVVAGGRVEVVELGRLDPGEVARLYLDTAERLRDYPHLSRAHRAEVDGRLRAVLEWLWRSVAAKVLDAVGDADRLWWCPVGPFGLLPLHAAQWHDPVALTDSGVLDRVVSSYTPTLRALLEARERPEVEADVLAVALPETPGKPPLPHAVEEVRSIGPARSVLDSARATVTAVRAAVAEHSWLHYAGHSSQDLRHPAATRLDLHDGGLAAIDLARLDLSAAELAYLSSCESGLGGADLPDEAIHLAGAFHVAGFRHVVANLNSVGDHTARLVAGLVYDRLRASGRLTATHAARCLTEVLREVRTDHPLAAWVGYHHIGP